MVHIDYAPSISNAGVRGVVTNVSHGTFYGQRKYSILQALPKSGKPNTDLDITAASLIIFSFLFRSGDHGFRFKKTNVKITFANPPVCS